MKDKTRVIIAMSGGVDSGVAAARRSTSSHSVVASSNVSLTAAP